MLPTHPLHYKLVLVDVENGKGAATRLFGNFVKNADFRKNPHG